MTVVHFAGKPLFAATLLFSTHLVGATPRTGDSVLQSEQMYDDETMLAIPERQACEREGNRLFLST